MSKYVTLDADGRATAFYDEAVHGTYFTQIPDPNWTAPQVPDPEWSPPLILDPD